MKKFSFDRKIVERALELAYKPDRVGAKWLVGAISRYRNAGELAEILVNFYKLGLVRDKDGNTPFHKGADIPELKASIKSARASLHNVNEFKTDSKEKAINDYINNSFSNLHIYVIITEKTVDLYEMNKTECSNFLKIALVNKASNGFWRFKNNTKEMKKWLTEKSTALFF